MLLQTQTSSNTTATRATIAETDYLFGGKFGAQNFAKGMLELKIATEQRGGGRNGGNGVGHFTADCPNKVAQRAGWLQRQVR